MMRKAEWPKCFFKQRFARGEQGLHQAAIGGCVGAERRTSGVETLLPRQAGSLPHCGALEHCRCAVVERMGERRGRMNPLQAMVSERERAKEGRGDRHRMDGGAEVVLEAGKRQLFGASTAAESGLSFEDDDGAALPGYGNRGGEA